VEICARLPAMPNVPLAQRFTNICALAEGEKLPVSKMYGYRKEACSHRLWTVHNSAIFMFVGNLMDFSSTMKTF